MKMLALMIAAGAATPNTVLLEQTFLKAAPGQVDRLQRYIELNWFALDSVALKQGLFTSYHMLKPAETDAEWDLIVSVGYPQVQGFEDPETQRAWQTIKASHRDVPIDGRTFQELGQVVRTERLKGVAGKGTS